MKIIDGRILPDAGEVTIGQTIKIGYYTQEIEQDENAGIAYMDPKLRVIDYIKNTAEYVRTEDGLVSASAMLDQFLFPPEEQYGQIKKTVRRRKAQTESAAGPYGSSQCTDS